MPVCTRCTANLYLQRWIETHGRLQPCSVCASTGQVAVDTNEFLRYVDSVIRRDYSPVNADDGGEPAEPLITRMAQVNAALARAVTDVRHAHEPLGGSFCDYGPLVCAARWSHEDSARWERLRHTVKHEARFFGADTRGTLDAILGGMESFCGGVAIRTLGFDDRVYRSRLARSPAEASGWFKSPEVSLHAPPADRATSGRMNAAGVRVFYGALEERIAVAEVRPPIGSHVVVGAFAPTRELRILDLGALGQVFDYADLFSQEFDSVSNRLTLLHMLEQEISLPVQPHDEVLEYVPTQVISEYKKLALGLDGVAYRSAQVGMAPGPRQVAGPALSTSERNVVSFGDAAITIAEERGANGAPGLRFLPDSQKMLDITKIEIATN